MTLYQKVVTAGQEIHDGPWIFLAQKINLDWMEIMDMSVQTVCIIIME